MKANYGENKKGSDIDLRVENEIKLWKEDLTKKSTYDDEYSYEFLCMDCAKDLYYELLRQGHNENSINVVIEFLKRLIDEKPLTPLIGDYEEWVAMEGRIDLKTKKNIHMKYQNKRYANLFKDVYEDGDVVYRDNNRVTCYDPIMETYFDFGLANIIYDDMNPIKMPYYPGEYDVTITVFTFQYNKETADKSDFDTAVILDIIDHDGDIEHVNRFFREPKEGEEPTIGGWVEIGIVELKDRVDNGTLKNLDLIDLGLDEMYHVAIENSELG